MVRNITSPRSLPLRFLLLAGGLYLLVGTGCRSILKDLVLADESGTGTLNGPPVVPMGGRGGEGAGGTGDGAGGGSMETAPEFNCPEVGLFYCDGRALQKCTEVETGTDWFTTEVCASEALCVEMPGECLPQLCEPGELRCNGEGLENCGAGLDRWSPLQFCESAGHCDNVEERACRLSSCVAGERRCNDGALEQCADDVLGYDVVQTCESQALCELTQDRCALEGGCAEVPECAVPVCAAGETRCLGAEFQRCNLGRTAFETDVTCVSAELCSAGPVVQGCQPEVCAPGQNQCSGAVLELCAPGQHQFERINTCINSAHCDPVVGECGAADCQPGERRCNGRQIEVCNADQTAFVATDEAQCATAALCRNNGNNQVFCQAPACQPNQFSCNDVQLLRCNAGQTAFESSGQQNCATPQLCNAAERRCEPPICRAGFNSCAGSVLQVCQQGRNAFDRITDCQNQGGCNPTTGQCGDPCLVGQPRCNGSIVEQCANDRDGWQQIAFCASNELCARGVAEGGAQGRCAAPVCDANEVRCQGNQLQRCNSGRTGFDTLQTCNGNQICDAAGVQCDNCQPNEVSCQGNQLRRCSSNGQQEVTQETCPSANLCSAGDARCFRCAPAGGRRCAGDQILFECADDQASESQIEVCRESGLCQASGTTGQCLECGTPGQSRCDGADVRQCTNQNTEFTFQTCVNAALCEDNGSGQAACQGPICPNPGGFICNEIGELRRCGNDQNRTDLEELCQTPPLCNAAAGRCDEPVCASGERECRGSQVFACNAARNGFTPVETCDTPELCQDNNNGQASCNDAVCAPGERQCDGSELQTCSTGLERFVRLDGCGSAALCANTLDRQGATTCDTCAGASCSGATLVQCEGGQPGSNFDCEFGCSSGSCEQCSDEDCPGSQICFQNRCVVCTSDGTGCVGNSNGQQCRNTEQCVECLEDNQCDGSTVCIGNQCEPCRVGSDCNDNDVCTVESCSADNTCQSASLCTGSTPVCTSDGQCVGTCIESECGIFGCNAGLTGCNDCNENTNCNSDSITVGSCEVAACNGQSCEPITSCNQGQLCTNNACVDPCGPANCNASSINLGECQFADCNGESCQAFDQCEAGEVCIEGTQCIEECGPENCTANDVNLGPCQQAACGGANGQECLAVGGCDANEFCTGDNQCVAACDENSNCQGSESECSTATCGEGNECVTTGCSSSEVCVAGDCEDRCDVNTNCAPEPGNCIETTCGADNACVRRGCGNGLSCVSGQCAELCDEQSNCQSNAINCVVAACSEGNECVVRTCDANTEICQGGSCLDRCVDADCAFGCNAAETACNDCNDAQCDGGNTALCTVAECVGNACSVGSICSGSETCINGDCQDTCSDTNCVGNTNACTEAQCLANNQCSVTSTCVGGESCFNGECEVACNAANCGGFGCDQETNECNACNDNQCNGFGCNNAGTACNACADDQCTFGCASNVACLTCNARTCNGEVVTLGTCDVAVCVGESCIVQGCANGLECNEVSAQCESIEASAAPTAP